MFPGLCRRGSVSPCVGVWFKGLDSVPINKEGAWVPPWVPPLGRDILLGQAQDGGVGRPRVRQPLPRSGSPHLSSPLWHRLNLCFFPRGGESLFPQLPGRGFQLLHRTSRSRGGRDTMPAGLQRHLRQRGVQGAAGVRERLRAGEARGDPQAGEHRHGRLHGTGHIHLWACAPLLSVHRLPRWPAFAMGLCTYSPCSPRHLRFPLK